MTYEPLEGIFPASNLPFREDLEIDEEGYRRHLRWLIGVDGVRGVVCNGHAAELESLNREERRRAIEITAEELRGKKTVVAGVIGGGTRELVEGARDAKEAGADALMIFPSPWFVHAGARDPRVPLAYIRAAAEATRMPLVIFQYNDQTGCTYPVEVIRGLGDIPEVVSIKDASLQIEADYVALRMLPRRISILTARGNLFLPRFLMADGAVTSFGNVVPHEVCELFRLVKSGKMEEAVALQRRLAPVSRAIYAHPCSMLHWVREKETLVARGKWASARVRPPLLPIGEAEREEIRQAVREAGLS